MRPVHIIALALALALQPLHARIGLVRTTRGQEYLGHVRLTSAGVRIVNADQDLVLTVPSANVVSLTYPQREIAGTAEAPEFGALPGSWREMEIGSVQSMGSTRVDKRSFTVRGAGTGFDGESDSFHYVYQAADGDYDFVARIFMIQDTGQSARAGLMIRETMSDYSRYLALVMSPYGGGAFQWRSAEHRPAEATAQAGLRVGHWLRLRRRGPEFTAYASVDGRQWTVLNQGQFPITGSYYVGLCVASGRADAINWSTFDRVRHGGRLGNEEFTPLVELTSGTTMRGAVEGVPGEFSIRAGSQIDRVPASGVARIIFQPLTSELAWKTRVSRAGVWTPAGDFFESDFMALENGRLRTSSVLYGLRTFEVSDEVSALVLQHLVPRSLPVHMETVEGALYAASGVTFGDGEAVLTEPALGSVKIPSFSIRELRTRR